jgi:hyperosmotically inducible periplasmic protein
MNVRKVLTALLLLGGAFAAVGCAHYGRDQTGREVISDSTITTKVKTALLAEKDVNSLDISVETFDRIVQLSGFVDSQWQIDKAVKVASGVAGVQHVKNDLVRK